MIECWQKPLNWGPTLEEIKEKYGEVSARCLPYDYRSIKLFGFTIMNFIGDCGSLYIQGANNATYENLRKLINFASEGGWSKIFATVVTDEPEKAKEAFKKAQFKKVSEGKSNRNPHKTDIVYVKVIKNCEYKGY